MTIDPYNTTGTSPPVTRCDYYDSQNGTYLEDDQRPGDDDHPETSPGDDDFPDWGESS